MAGVPPATVTVNVSTLSNALAVAIQQATAQSSNEPAASASVSSQQSQTPTASGQGQPKSYPSASVLLPSYLKRKKRVRVTNSKRPKKVQSWDRDIICLPDKGEGNHEIPYPRGQFRSSLGLRGLIGKLRLQSFMTVEEVQNEIRSVFKKPMGSRSDFPFIYLQSTGAGSRTLTVPHVSDCFEWTAQVSKLGTRSQSIYIMAKDNLVEDPSDDETSDSEQLEQSGVNASENEVKEKVPDDRTNAIADYCDTQSTSSTSATLAQSFKYQADDTYCDYINLIDLTQSPDEESEGSEIDALPHVPVNLSTESVSRSDSIRQDTAVSKHVILQHQSKVISGSHEDQQRLSVRRTHLFADAVRAFSRHSFTVSKMLKVVFIGEQAVDDGGPRREFFRLLMKEAFRSSGLFSGWPCNVVPVHNVEAVVTNKYYLVGKMITTSLIQGGQPPVCFSKAVANYLVYDKVSCKPDIEDIPNFSLQQTLRKVQEVTSTAELRFIVQNEFDVRFECGYAKATHLIDLSHKDEIVKALWLHHIFFFPHAELDQLKKGFRETLQMEVVVCLHPRVVLGFLIPSGDFDVTAEYLLDSLVINYSAQGCNKQTAEEALVLNWSDYVSDCTGEPISIGDILQFFSGSNRLPASGFSNTPSIHFTDEACLPKASTCDLSITFSRSWGLLSPSEFKSKMDMSICNSVGFGKP